MTEHKHITVSFADAASLLAEKLGTPREAIVHELCGWVSRDDLAAYEDWKLTRSFSHTYLDRHARYLEQSQRTGFEYLPLMQAFYFKKSDLESFNPPYRYIRGDDLLCRWGGRCGSREGVVAKVEALADDGRLFGFHPLNFSAYPKIPELGLTVPFERHLFCLDEITLVEPQDFVNTLGDESSPFDTPTQNYFVGQFMFKFDRYLDGLIESRQGDELRILKSYQEELYQLREVNSELQAMSAFNRRLLQDAEQARQSADALRREMAGMILRDLRQLAESDQFGKHALTALDSRRDASQPGHDEQHKINAPSKPEWVKQAWDIGEAWMLLQEKKTGERPGVIAISKYVEGEMSNQGIKGVRGTYLDAATIKREALNGITGRQRNGKKAKSLKK